MVEKPQALNELCKPFNLNDELTFMIARGGGSAMHDLNAFGGRVLEKYGIDFRFSEDFKYSEEGIHALYEMSKKFNKNYKGVAKSCWALAHFFLRLADMTDLIEKAAE